VNDARDDLLDRPLRDLWAGELPSALATAAANALFRAEIYTVRELLTWSAEDLLRPGNVRQFGPGLLAEVRRVLAVHGLALAGESPERGAR
jgi:hypothetical protein